MLFCWKASTLSVFWEKLTAVTLIILAVGTCCSSLLPSTELWSTKTSIFTVRIRTLQRPDKHHFVNHTANRKEEDIPSLVQRVQRRMTQSREAKWASVSLSAICILLVLSVCYSKMWKDYRGAQYYHPNLPVLKDSIPLIDVLSRKLRFTRKPQYQPVKLQEDEEDLLA